MEPRTPWRRRRLGCSQLPHTSGGTPYRAFSGPRSAMIGVFFSFMTSCRHQRSHAPPPESGGRRRAAEALTLTSPPPLPPQSEPHKDDEWMARPGMSLSVPGRTAASGEGGRGEGGAGGKAGHSTVSRQSRVPGDSGAWSRGRRDPTLSVTSIQLLGLKRPVLSQPSAADEVSERARESRAVMTGPLVHSGYTASIVNRWDCSS